MVAENTDSHARELRNEPLTDEDLAGYWATRIEPWVYDFDYLGHLTAATYPKAFEEARVRYFRDRWAVDMPMYVVATHTMHYVKELREEDAPLHVLVRPVRIGRASMQFEELLLDDHKRICAVSEVTLVAWDLEARTSRAFTEPERLALETDRDRLQGVTSRSL